MFLNVPFHLLLTNTCNSEMGGQTSSMEGVHVVVVGGGFGGIAAAQHLKAGGLSFTLIDMRDAFHHNVAALRASIQPGTPLVIWQSIGIVCSYEHSTPLFILHCIFYQEY